MCCGGDRGNPLGLSLGVRNWSHTNEKKNLRVSRLNQRWVVEMQLLEGFTKVNLSWAQEDGEEK